MFSSGIFIIICTILRAHYSLASITSLPIALGWADRECFVAAIVASLPGIKPLFRNTRLFGSTNRKAAKKPGYNGDKYNNFTAKGSGKTKTFISSGRSGSRGQHFEMDSVLQTKNMGSRLSSGGSEECILETAKGARLSTEAQRQDDLAIHVTTEYSLESEQRLSGHPSSPLVD